MDIAPIDADKPAYQPKQCYRLGRYEKGKGNWKNCTRPHGHDGLHERDGTILQETWRDWHSPQKEQTEEDRRG